MKRNRNTPPINNKRLFAILLTTNIILAISVAILVLNKLNILHNPFSSQQLRTYLDNGKYDPYVSMFRLNTSSCDVVFAGDSLTERCHFDELLTTDKTILNRGIGGDFTEGLAKRTDEILSHNPSKIFIMIGINDISTGLKSGDIIPYYRDIFEQIKQANPSITVIVQSVLPVLQDYNEEVTRFNSDLATISNEYGYVYLDINTLFWSDGSVIPQFFADDGIHLNGAGYMVWMDAIKDLI